jgi:hypothetical protein
MGKKKKASRLTAHTSLAQHRKVGSRLVPPLADTNLTPLKWDRDWLPEYLWIASLREVCPIDQLFKPYYTFMDAVEEFWLDTKTVPLGLLTDFHNLSSNANDFTAKHRSLVDNLFLKPSVAFSPFFQNHQRVGLLRNRSQKKADILILKGK